MIGKLSILGLYNWDNTIFDDLALPQHVYVDENDQEQTEDAIDKQTLVDNLLMDLAEISVIITDPDVMKLAIKSWSASCLPVWQALWDTTQYEYNPIWNKDGTVTEVEERDLEKTTDATETRNLTGSNDIQVDSKTSAFNSSTMQPVDQVITDQDTTDGGTIDYDNTVTDGGRITRTRTEHGNIGVTTTQQMIKEQRDIVNFNIYRVIIEDFKQRFCIMVY